MAAMFVGRDERQIQNIRQSHSHKTGKVQESKTRNQINNQDIKNTQDKMFSNVRQKYTKRILCKEL